MKMTINKVELNGFVGINPEVKTLENGKTFTRFALATSDNYKDKNGAWVYNTIWHNIIVWGRKTKVEEIKKGSRVQVIGKLKNGHYHDKNGVTIYTTEIVTTKLETIHA